MTATRQIADETVRLDAWRSVFEKANRIISGRPVTVQIVGRNDIPGGMESTPGWSDGEVVHFNGPLVIDMLKTRDSMDAVLRLKGLNYHELSHVLYTPRMADELPRKVVNMAKVQRDNTWWYAFNALEDQRIETWFTSVYGPSSRYFEAAVLQWLITHGNTEAAILVYGRKYLPARLRVQAGRVFTMKHGRPLYDEFKAVIDGYLRLVLPGDTIKGFKAVSEFHELLKRLQAPNPPLPIEDNGAHSGGAPQHGGGDDVVRKGRVLQRQARDAAEAAADKIDAAAAADAEHEAKHPDTVPAPPKSGKPGDEKGDAGGTSGVPSDDAKAAGTPGDGDGSEPSDGVTGTSDSDGVGNEAVEHHVMDRAEVVSQQTLGDAYHDLVDEAHKALDDIKDDADIHKDVDAVLEAVKSVAHNGVINANGVMARNRSTMPALERHNLAVRKVVTILTRIRQEAEPQTLRRQVTGRIDGRRLLTRRPNEVDIFTSYDEGMDEESGIEAVVLLDVSGSMMHIAEEASAAVWVLKRAFDKLEIRTTVLAYDTNHSVIWRASDKASSNIPVINTGGGTNPSSALHQAYLVLGKSQAKNKVLISVTDGQWPSGKGATFPQTMKAIEALGVTSLLLGVNGALAGYGNRGHTEGHELQTVSDLPKAALTLVARIMRNSSERI